MEGVAEGKAVGGRVVAVAIGGRGDDAEVVGG